MDQDEILHLRKLKQINEEQLQTLKQQAATFGELYVPPYIESQIKSRETEIEKVNARLAATNQPPAHAVLQNMQNAVKVLFLSAEPSDAARLRLGQELRDIREKLQLAKQRDNFVLESREAVRPGDITQAIFDVDPQIVHFSGHGTSTGELCLESTVGKVQPVKPDALAALFELVADRVDCVILNACYSEIQAKAIAQHIPCVIGMGKAIGDKAAIAFAAGFYKALGASCTIQKAYKFGCVEMQLENTLEHLTPVLIQKDKTQP